MHKHLPLHCLPVLIVLWSVTYASPHQVAEAAGSASTAGDPAQVSKCPPPLDSSAPLVPQTIEHLGEVELAFDNGVSQTDRERIAAGLIAVRSYISATFTTGLPDLVCLDVRALAVGPVGSGRCVGKQIILFTSDQGWPVGLEWHLSQVVAHEYVHAWQSLGGDISSSPTWLIEGMAEWISLQAMLRADLMTPGQLADASRMPTVPWRTPLVSLESVEGWHSMFEPYPIAIHAVEMLVSGNGPGAMEAYLTNLGEGLAWRDAFEKAFGSSPKLFYDRFEAAR